MPKLFCTLFLLLPGIVVPINSRATDLDLHDLSTMNESQWMDPEPGMSPREYQQVASYNRRLLRRAMTEYLASRFASLGVPERTLNLTGSALFLAFKHDAEFNLNESKTMALEFFEVTDEDRAVLYKIKFNW